MLIINKLLPPPYKRESKIGFRAFFLRCAVVFMALMTLDLGEAWGQRSYVFVNTKTEGGVVVPYYLTHTKDSEINDDNYSLTAITSFHPEMCRWYLDPDPYVNTTIQARKIYATTTNPNATKKYITGSSSALYLSTPTNGYRGATNKLIDRLRYSDDPKRYIYFDNSDKTWKMDKDSEEETWRYDVTAELSKTFTRRCATIAGRDWIFANDDYTYSVTTFETVTYDKYEFYNNTSGVPVIGPYHFWYDETDHLSSSGSDLENQSWAGTVTTTWSLEHAEGYATFDASTRKLHVTNVPIEPVVITLTATATDGTYTVVGTKEITLCISGFDDDMVIIDDLEDHTWTYYSGTSVEGYNTNPNYLNVIYSPDPRNVKITYQGGGVEGGSSVAVSGMHGEGQNTFVYYKTIEKTQFGDDVNYAYQVISNPFSKRPKVGDTYYGFGGWKVISGGDYILEYDDDDILPLDPVIHFVSLSYLQINCISAEIVFEATWVPASVTKITDGGSNYTYSAGSGTYETNFLVIAAKNFNHAITANSPVTIMQVEPDWSNDYRDNIYPSSEATRTFDKALIPNNSQMTKMEHVKWGYKSDIDLKGKNTFLGRGVIRPTSSTIFGYKLKDTYVNQTIKVENGSFYSFRPLSDSAYVGNAGRLEIVLGCDYDRAKNDNDKLLFTGGFVLSQSPSGSSPICMGIGKVRVTVKSGKHQTQFLGGSAEVSSNCFYISNPGYAEGSRQLTVEGGELVHIAGGAIQRKNLLTVQEYRNFVDTRIRIKGGLIHGAVFGGAARIVGHGSKSIVITGGQIEGWVAGAANGHLSDVTEGVTYGTSYVYVGGNARVDSKGNMDGVDHSLGGNVYGAGAGNSTSPTGGQMVFGSNVVIADYAYVERGVYGGGARGSIYDGTIPVYPGDPNNQYHKPDVPSPANIFILDDCTIGSNYDSKYNIWGGVYGGAREKSGGIVNIYIAGGTIKHTTFGSSSGGGVYGGSNDDGRIFGKATINMTGGTVEGSVFGGGRGADTWMDLKGIGETNTTSGTPNPVSDLAAEVNISGGHVLGNVYGGSEKGKVKESTVVNIAGSALVGVRGVSNGGRVFAGGRGKFSDTDTDLDLNYGDVQGNATLNVSGGTIYNGIYGGGELSNVGETVTYTYEVGHTINVPTTDASGNVTTGITTVNLSGGTIGYERSLSDIDANHNICHVFGAGMGSPSSDYNTWTNVNKAVVNITGSPRIYGSVFGGSDVGHVLGNISVNVSMSSADDTLGTYGYSEIDGNIFGGGHGFVSEGSGGTQSVTAGGTQGNINVHVSGSGLILGTVFGGGRIASAGIVLSDDSSIAGDSIPDAVGKQFGHVNVLVEGNVVIGHDPVPGYLAGDIGGNVYGGAMGLDLAPDTVPGKMSHVKQTQVTVQGSAKVKGSINGGGESGDVWRNTQVLIAGNCEIGLDRVGSGHLPLDSLVYSGNVFGGSWGSDSRKYVNMGRVYGNTNVTISGGTVRNCVYGGGEYASVGTIDTISDVPTPRKGTGRSTVVINGGVIGPLDASERNAWVLGGGMGVDTTGYYTAGINYNKFGQVFSSNVLITGGIVGGCVFGGGRMGSVGTAITPPDGFDNYGHTNVSISGGTIGNANTSSSVVGNVYGGGMGNIKHEDYALAFHTNVHISGTAHVTGSVFGGSRDSQIGFGAVSGSTHVLISGGNIGTSGNSAAFKGYVYGGGRGYHIDPSNPVADQILGKVNGSTQVTITNGHVWQYVFGGGNQSIVTGHKCVNMVGGTVHKDVYGGSNATMTGSGGLLFFSGLKTVNVYGGTVRNVYGCSRYAVDGEEFGSKDDEAAVTAFVNISGGTITGRIHGAGHADQVQGSVVVNIGANAINNNPYRFENVDKDNTGTDTHLGYTVHAAHALNISGSVYGGSDYLDATNNDVSWNTKDISGYCNIYIDGKGYDSGTESSKPMINISGQVYGSGTHCESGTLGRNIFISHYGERIATSGGQVTSATRNLTTIQRCGNLVIDSCNFLLTGAKPIDGSSEDFYSVFKVDTCMYVTNASALGLGLEFSESGSTIPAQIANMDSIRRLQSAYLISGNIYSNKFAGKLSWGWIGLKDSGSSNADELCYMSKNEQDEWVGGDGLGKDDENVILFNGETRLYVRYHTGNLQEYGELKGFFRMFSPFKPKGLQSFAFARPKIMDGTNQYNMIDGGFLSYNTAYNNFLAGGYGSYTNYTNTRQYPYTNVLGVQLSKNEFPNLDVQDYRMWVWAMPFEGRCWYVDGRAEGNGGIGADEIDNDRGLFPDKPKLSVSGTNGVYDGTKHSPTDQLIEFDYDGSKMLPEETTDDPDIIFVVGAIRDVNEITAGLNKYPVNELRLFRYPGGHTLSSGSASDPGANYGAMLEVTGDKAISMNNVSMDGLYGHTSVDREYLRINSSFDQDEVSKPMVVTTNNAVLTLTGSYSEKDNGSIKTKGTVLTRGYNNTDASTITIIQDEEDYSFDNYFVNSGFMGSVTVTSGDPPTSTDYHITNGGAMFVDSTATVNVEGLVRIFDNRQKNGSDAILSNVYLPKFETHLNITNTLAENTRIGVTNPIRNKESIYTYNTFSPIVVAVNASFASDAWNKEVFRDDMGRFFRNGGKSTYYEASIAHHPGYIFENGTNLVPITVNKTIFLGWTWANVVRTAPMSYSDNNINSAEGLAWLISLVNGLNGQTASNLSGRTFYQTADIDLQQYVWVPIGSENSGAQAFCGNYEGQGHLIKNLSIDYIGEGDGIYAPLNKFGLFGLVRGAEINRTFVVKGHIHPVGTAISGGLAGWVEKKDSTVPAITNSEAAVEIVCPTTLAEVASGGLVGFLVQGQVHSSMSMSNLQPANGYPYIGGLIGCTGDLGGQVGSGEITVKNSFANASFILPENPSGIKVGGLIGYNFGDGEFDNCYANVHAWAHLTTENFALLAYNNSQFGGFNRCYYPSAFGTHPVCADNQGNINASCAPYSPVISSDELGYMYADNKIEGDTTLAARLTMNVWAMHEELDDPEHENPLTDSIYAHWARPTLSEINGDYPVPLLCEFDSENDYQGSFRSVGTYAGGPALQYGGPVRDGTITVGDETRPNELDAALTRTKDGSAGDCLFVYGDVNTVGTGLTVTQSKVSIHEDAAILHPGVLGYSGGESATHYTNTYVGVTFDNPSRSALDYYGNVLNRDWHMFSTPLHAAPLGMDYRREHDGNLIDENLAGVWVGTYPNDNNKYVYNFWDDEPYDLPQYKFYEASERDGYFPSQVPNTQKEKGDPNVYEYPYDFFCWYEPDWQWINFKRNGVSHWHYDYDDDHDHPHINYKAAPSATVNLNETNLVVGKGYMMSINEDTYLQSHGELNKGAVNVEIYYTSANVWGVGNLYVSHNLIGNPYHAYLDFAKTSLNSYYVYDAEDGGSKGLTKGGYLIYPSGGSKGGYYAPRYLHPHQGFFVKVKSAAPVLFNESMCVSRTMAGGSEFRDEQPTYPLVNLFAYDKDGRGDVVVVEFNRPENGGGLKAKALRNGRHQIYARFNGEDYGAFFAKQGTERVPVWFKTDEESAVYTLRWNTRNGDFTNLRLIDNILGVNYDMLTHDSYYFEASNYDYAARFYIVFSCTDVEEHEVEPEDGNFAFFDGSQWVVNGSGQLELIDMMGRVLQSVRVAGDQNRISLSRYSSGVYLLRLCGNKSVKVQKIVITK